MISNVQSRVPYIAVLLQLLSLLTGCGSGISTQPAPIAPSASSKSIWVGAWGASMTNARLSGENSGGVDRTFRFLVTSTIDGSQARVKFSNIYGTSPVTIGAARLARGQDGSSAIDPTHDVGLAFGGNGSTILASGSTVTSDPVAISFGSGQVLAVTVYLKGSFGPVSRHASYFVTNFATADRSGDKTTDSSGSSFTKTLGDWLLVNEIDVYGQYQGTLAMFGSSTTDGYKSDYSSDRIYPVPNVPIATQHADRVSDWMARRLSSMGYRIGVINSGIPGDTIAPNSGNTVTDTPNANNRFTSDVLSIPNLVGIVSYFGSIDLRSADCASAPEMETATQQLVSSAFQAKVAIVLATLPPTALCTNPSKSNYGPIPSSSDPYAGGPVPGPPNGAEVQRAAFNQWLRTSAISLNGVAGIADYDKTLSDPQHPSFMLPRYNSGDNFHMNGAGYQAESLVIPLNFLQGN